MAVKDDGRYKDGFTNRKVVVRNGCMALAQKEKTAQGWLASWKRVLLVSRSRMGDDVIYCWLAEQKWWNGPPTDWISRAARSSSQSVLIAAEQLTWAKDCKHDLDLLWDVRIHFYILLFSGSWKNAHFFPLFYVVLKNPIENLKYSADHQVSLIGCRAPWKRKKCIRRTRLKGEMVRSVAKIFLHQAASIEDQLSFVITSVNNAELRK